MSLEAESSEDFFNDPIENDDHEDDGDEIEKDGESTRNVQTGQDYVPRPKRIACILCRKRKLRCDGQKPSCGTCSRLGHDCAYDEVRKKSGPKRGYVKLLEQRLKQVEDLLENRETLETVTRRDSTLQSAGQQQFPSPTTMENTFTSTSNIPVTDPSFVDPTLSSMMADFGVGGSDDFSWEMIGLGLDEPLPTQDVIDDMNQIYFEKIHSSLPMIHKARYYAAMNLAPHMRPPVGLRYSMWTLACSVTPRYSALVDHFYARARKYLQQDEMRGHGETSITLAHGQAWTLVACFEFKMMYFPRAWMSCGRANRLAQMMGLHRQDGVGLDVKQTLLPPRDWTEREERRRTFWMIFCQDRYASIGTGWPMTIDEQDIMTNLPASEVAFNTSQPEPTLPLSEALTGDGASSLSSFAGVVLLACMFGRNLTHLHRPNPEDKDSDLNGEFWKRHRTLDNILLNIALSLPSHLRLPDGLHNSNIIFCNMNIHTSTICLHQAAIFKADKNRMPAQISAESKRRCIIAADQITTIMKMSSHVDLATLNPFISFCLYVAARVFVQYLKSRRTDTTVRSSLQFLLSAMSALKAKNPLTESFLVQLEVDLEGSGLDIKIPPSSYALKVPGEIPINTDAVKCSPLFEIRQSQAQGLPVTQPQQTAERTTSSTAGDFPRMSAFDNSASTTHGAKQFQANRTAEIFPDGHNWTEMDMSPDGSGATRISSGQPTPSSTSNKASSHTSFSPPQNLGISPNMLDSNSPSSLPPFQNTSTFGQYPSSVTGVNQSTAIGTTGPAGMQNPLAMPASWDLPNDGLANSGLGQQQHTPENITPDSGSARAETAFYEVPRSNQTTGASEGHGMTPLTMPDWNMEGGFPDMGEADNWMYGDWSSMNGQTVLQ